MVGFDWREREDGVRSAIPKNSQNKKRELINSVTHYVTTIGREVKADKKYA
jgi:hypothetical protein